MTRSRRAGLTRDEARQQPLYARMLGLRYLAPGGFLCFVFGEGAVALGILLALAELVSWWGVLVLPAMVATMVKLNDVVAGLLIPPVAAGRSRQGLRPATSDAVPGGGPPGGSLAGGRSPRGRSSGSSPGAETVRLSPAAIAQVGSASGAIAQVGSAPAASGPPPLRPAAVRSAATGVGEGDRWALPAMDASVLNGPPVTRQWTEDLDDHQQRARQSAARRYEWRRSSRH